MSDEVKINESPEYLALVNIIYPVGHIYKSTKDINPSTFIPGTNWARIEGRFLYNSGSQIIDRTGGVDKAELRELPVHNHEGSIYNRKHYGNRPPETFFEANSKINGPGAYPADIETTSYGVPIDPSDPVYPTHNNMPPYIAIYMWRRTS